MKQTLVAGVAVTKRVLVDEERCISFMGQENMVYATPRMVSDVEYACRDFLLAHLDPGEDSVAAPAPGWPKVPGLATRRPAPSSGRR